MSKILFTVVQSCVFLGWGGEEELCVFLGGDLRHETQEIKLMLDVRLAIIGGLKGHGPFLVVGQVAKQGRLSPLS